MRIAVVGPNRVSAIVKAEDVLKVKSKSPLINPYESVIVNTAVETYRYQDENNVIFDGSVFDYLKDAKEEGYDDVYEQIALASLTNLDYVIVVTSNMDQETLDIYKNYAEVYPNKFHFYGSAADVEITMK